MSVVVGQIVKIYWYNMSYSIIQVTVVMTGSSKFASEMAMVSDSILTQITTANMTVGRIFENFFIFVGQLFLSDSYQFARRVYL